MQRYAGGGLCPDTKSRKFRLSTNGETAGSPYEASGKGERDESGGYGQAGNADFTDVNP